MGIKKSRKAETIRCQSENLHPKTAVLFRILKSQKILNKV